MWMYRLALLWPIPRLGLSNCDFVSVSKDGFISVSVNPVDDQLNLIM
jgi:hypothetical protein